MLQRRIFAGIDESVRQIRANIQHCSGTRGAADAVDCVDHPWRKESTQFDGRHGEECFRKDDQRDSWRLYRQL